MIWCDYCAAMVWPDHRCIKDWRWTLTQRGWCEAMGISSAVAEVLGR